VGGDIWDGSSRASSSPIPDAWSGIAIFRSRSARSARNICTFARVILVCRGIVAAVNAPPQRRSLSRHPAWLRFFGFGALARFPHPVRFAIHRFMSKTAAEDIEETEPGAGRGDPRPPAPSCCNGFKLRAFSRSVMPRPDRLVMYRLRTSTFRESAVLGLVGARWHRRNAQHRLSDRYDSIRRRQSLLIIIVTVRCWEYSPAINPGQRVQ